MELQQRLEQAILKTPTGKLRNLLCDINLSHFIFRKHIVLTKEDLGECYKEVKAEEVSIGMIKLNSMTTEESNMAHIIVYIDESEAIVLKNNINEKSSSSWES